MTKRLAICLGLTHVDPDEYDGWEGECPGCDIDAAKFAKLCHDAGFDGVHVGVNRMASATYLYDVFHRTTGILSEGDLLVLYYSGHGGQQRDLDGDEEDGKDETLCLWDGELVDDSIGDYLRMVPAGVRILMVTDSCHSGTNYRARREAPSLPVQLSKSPKDISASLLHFGGCSDDRYSYGDTDGGVFTMNLVKAAHRGRKPLKYHEWFARANKLMPSYQAPTVSTWGPDSFLDMEMLT